jgi:DNA repair protein RecN (Recombination protein N)
VREAHKVWIALVNRTVELEGKARDRESKLELIRFQVSELKALDLKEGESRTARRRTHASLQSRPARRSGAGGGWPALRSDDGKRTRHRVARPGGNQDAVERRSAARQGHPMVDEATIQIREAARELSRYLETLDIDPARQEEVERRLAAVEELSRKHRVQTFRARGRAATLEKRPRRARKR